MPKIIPAISETEPALTRDEACEYLGGISRQALHDYVRKGRHGKRLAVYKIGGHIWFLPADLKAFVAHNSEPVVEQPAEPRTRRTGKMSAETTAELRRFGFKV